MIKAIVKQGVLVPHEPLPIDWTDGTEVDVGKSKQMDAANGEVDRWLAELDAIASQGDRDEDQRLDAALAQHRQEQKSLAREKTGTPE